MIILSKTMKQLQHYILPCLFWMVAGLSQAAIVPMDDADLSDVTGQALFNSQKITSTVQAGITFYRLMLDVQLDMNMNIESLKLGCGGVNNNLRAGVCDIDLSNVSLMGRDAGATGAGAIGSDFKLKRPYLEFAIKNDGNKATREVIGIKIGAQEADGFMGIGRYNPSAAGCTGASYGAGAYACHTGITSISGYLNVDLSATVEGSGTVLGFVPVTFKGCFGATSDTSDNCGPGAVFTQVFNGTRMTDIALPDKSLDMQVYGGAFDITGRADVFESLRFLHEIVLQNTQNFGLSFQREQVRYPNFDASTYAVMANTGFWFNIPYAKARDGYADVGNVGDLNSALGSGKALADIDLNQRPPDNCYGSTTFC